jgi:hypothetical protein
MRKYANDCTAQQRPGQQLRLTNQACIALASIVDQALAHLLVDVGAEVVGAHLHRQTDISTGCLVSCC